MSDEPVTVLICDDHAEFRAGLHALLDTAPGLTVVGEAADGAEALARAARLQPDVVIMDLNMPGTNGIEGTRQIVATSPHIGVVVLTMLDDDDSVFAALRAGARGYLLKGARKADIVRTIVAVADGEALLGPALAQRLMHYFAERPGVERAQAFPQLTPREVDILALMAQHSTNPAIARHLGLSEKTVRNNVSNILTKLHVADRTQAIIAARDAGLTAQTRPRP